MTDRELIDLGLESYENGYYNITDEITVDVEGSIRIENEFTTKRIWLAQIYNVDELKVFIECIRR